MVGFKSVWKNHVWCCVSHYPDLHPSLLSLCLPVCECFHVEGMSSFKDHKTIPHPSLPALCLTHSLTGAGKHLLLPSTSNLSKTNSCGPVWVQACLRISQSGWWYSDRIPAACCQVAHEDFFLWSRTVPQPTVSLWSDWHIGNCKTE